MNEILESLLIGLSNNGTKNVIYFCLLFNLYPWVLGVQTQLNIRPVIQVVPLHCAAVQGSTVQCTNKPGIWYLMKRILYTFGHDIGSITKIFNFFMACLANFKHGISHNLKQIWKGRLWQDILADMEFGTNFTRTRFFNHFLTRKSRKLQRTYICDKTA